MSTEELIFRVRPRLLIDDGDGCRLLTWPYQTSTPVTLSERVMRVFKDTTKVLVFGKDDTLEILDYETGIKEGKIEVKERLTGRAPDSLASGVAYNPIRKHLLLNTESGKLQVYDLSCQFILEKDLGSWQGGFLVVGNFLIFANRDRVRIFDALSYEERAELEGRDERLGYFPDSWNSPEGPRLLFSNNETFIYNPAYPTQTPREIPHGITRVLNDRYGFAHHEDPEKWLDKLLIDLTTGEIVARPPDHTWSDGEDDQHILVVLTEPSQVISYEILTGKQKILYRNSKSILSARFLEGRREDRRKLVSLLAVQVCDNLPLDLVRLSVDFC